MNTTTLSDLILRCRERADEVNSAFVSDAELTRLINTKLQKLWDFLVTQNNDDLVVPPVTLAITSGQEWVALPLDFKQCVNLFALDGDDRILLRRMSPRELADKRDVWDFPNARLEPKSYRIIGKRIYLQPTDFEYTELELWYVPEMTKLSNNYDQVSAYLPDGWEECIVNGVAALIKLKKEADPSIYLGLETQYYTELATYAADRDASRPSRVIDVEEY